MDWNDAKGFNWGDVHSLQWDEIRLDAEKLIEKLRNDNRELPFSVIEKLQELCAALPETAPKVKKKMTISEACALLSFILNYITKLPEIAETYAPIVARIIEAIAKFLA